MDDARKKANNLLLQEQQENLLSTIDANPGGDEMENHEDITLCSGGEVEELIEVEKLQRVENDAQTSKDLVEKEEEESTSPESHEKIKDEVVKTILEMTLWGEMHEALKNEKMTPIYEVDEYII